MCFCPKHKDRAESSIFREILRYAFKGVGDRFLQCKYDEVSDPFVVVFVGFPLSSFCFWTVLPLQLLMPGVGRGALMPHSVWTLPIPTLRVFVVAIRR